MIKLYYWLKIIWLSLKWVPRINLGDRVVWLEDSWPHSCTVINGVCPESWKLSSPFGDPFSVKRSECRKIRTAQNYLNSFKSGYRFYMGYWFSIWCRRGIEPWVRNCNIW